MIKQDENKNATNSLPEGSFFHTCCGECQLGDYDSKRDQVWCGKDRKWYDKSDGCNRV